MVAMSAPVLAGSHEKASAKADKQSARHVVDSGTFGIYLNGRRIGTEKFHVEQGPNTSLATSEVTIDDGSIRASQSSELEVASNGCERSEEHTSELQSLRHLVCRLL